MKAYKKQGKADEIFGKFKDVMPEYVLAQNSNFSRVVYLAVKHAMDNGVLDVLKFQQSRPEESVSELD